MKKSFAMLVTLSLVVIFSFLFLDILQVKTLQTNINIKSYKNLQANFHLEFIKNFIINLDLNKPNEKCINQIILDNKQYNIYANIKYISNKKDCKNYINDNFKSTYSKGLAIIDIYVKAKDINIPISLHERLLKKL